MRTLCGAAILAGWLCAAAASAQQATIGAPFHNLGANYYERIGLGFSGNIGNNVFFNNGGMNGALPPFGGHNPANDARLGFGIRGGGVNLNFGLAAGTGYDANMTSVTPSVTVMNGGTGSIFSGQQRPFVTGVVPVVGQFVPGMGYETPPPRVTSPLQERLSRLEAEAGHAKPTPRETTTVSAAPRRQSSTAERGDLSLAEIRAAQANTVDTKQTELEALLESAKLREEAGEIGPALIDYGRAAARADGALKEELREKMWLLREKLKK
jgi:hypothetical protein